MHEPPHFGKHMELGDSFRSQIFQPHSAMQSTSTLTVAFLAMLWSRSPVPLCSRLQPSLDSGVNLQAEGEAQDPQVAFDKAFDRIEKRLRRYKRRLKDRNIEPVKVDDIALPCNGERQ